MNREIKFRIWNLHLNKFLYCDQHRFNCFGVTFRKTDALYAGAFTSGDGLTVQQFTGLLDKNGREIYEGDIITYVEKMHEHGDVQFLGGQVVYDSDKAAFGIAGIQTGEVWNYFTDMVISDFEVVGNVFENR